MTVSRERIEEDEGGAWVLLVSVVAHRSLKFQLQLLKTKTNGQDEAGDNFTQISELVQNSEGNHKAKDMIVQK